MQNPEWVHLHAHITSMMPGTSPESFRKHLLALGEGVRSLIIETRQQDPQRRFSDVSHTTVADIIYDIDALVEPAILAWLGVNWPRAEPVELVMEGLEERGPLAFPNGCNVAETKWKLIIDPIDGTRMLMHDKRPGWFIAGLAPQRGRTNTLADIEVAALVELPTTKQSLADALSAIRGQGLQATRADLITGTSVPLKLQPYQGDVLAHGFSSLVKFFLPAKEMTARIERDAIVKAYGDLVDGADIFDDQYISTGGQFYEMIAGRDRWLGDLRPLIFPPCGFHTTLACHPYDVAAALLLQEAGCIIEKPDGSPLDAPLDTTTPVAWVAYANPDLATRLRQPLQAALIKNLS